MTLPECVTLAEIFVTTIFSVELMPDCMYTTKNIEGKSQGFSKMGKSVSLKRIKCCYTYQHVVCLVFLYR